MNSSYLTQRRYAGLQSPSPSKSNAKALSGSSTNKSAFLSIKGNDDVNKSLSQYYSLNIKQEIEVLRQERDTAIIQNFRLEHDLSDTRELLAALRDEFRIEQEEQERRIATFIDKQENPQQQDDDANSDDSLLGPVNHELVESEDQVGDYQLSMFLGKGKFARVRRGIHCDTHQEYAIKCIDKSSIQTSQHMHQLVNELTVLLQISHPNVTRAVEVYHAPLTVYIVMELAYMDLFEYTRHLSKPLSNETLRELVLGILQPLEFLHSIGICHCDIKVENIVLVAWDQVITRKHVKLCDFGLCSISSSTDPTHPVLEQGFKGTIPLVAPEVILSHASNDWYDARPVDMWAVGCTLLELTDGYPEGWDEAYKLIRKDPVGFHEGIEACLVEIRARGYSNNDAFDIVCGLLRMAPEHRRTAARVLEHEWFDGCFDEALCQNV